MHSKAVVLSDSSARLGYGAHASCMVFEVGSRDRRWRLTAGGVLACAVACDSEAPLRSPAGGAAQGGSDAGASNDEVRDGGANTAPRTLSVPAFTQVHISSNPEAEHFQRATVQVDFGDEPVAQATLVVELESPCYPFDRWTPESIPPGHNWPRLCDAFDRTFLFSVDEPDDVAEGPPGLELVRAITPFGGPESFEVDVTDVVNGLLGQHQLTVDIQTWSDADGIVSGAEGEWIVSAHFELRTGPSPRRVLAVVPLFFGFEEDARPEPIVITTPEGTRGARLEYRATGHGGGAVDADCVGPAEEFCRRTHSLSLDGTQLSEFEPWRDDCHTLCSLASYESATLSIDSYCAENPCGAIESVRAPRANWCPGDITPPFVVENARLAEPGEHELTVEINQVGEGGSWLLSGVFIAYE